MITINSISIYTINGLTNQQVLQTIVGSHTRVFDKKNTYQSPMDAQDLNNWDQAIEEVKIFIKKNSKTHKTSLLNYFDLIKLEKQRTFVIVLLSLSRHVDLSGLKKRLFISTPSSR